MESINQADDAAETKQEWARVRRRLVGAAIAFAFAVWLWSLGGEPGAPRPKPVFDEAELPTADAVSPVFSDAETVAARVVEEATAAHSPELAEWVELDEGAVVADSPVAADDGEDGAPSDVDGDAAAVDDEVADEFAGEVASVAPAAGGVAVQVGAFRSMERAQAVAAALDEEGFAALIEPVDRNGVRLLRVRAQTADRADADAARARLRALGYEDARIVESL